MPTKQASNSWSLVILVAAFGAIGQLLAAGFFTWLFSPKKKKKKDSSS